MKRTLCGALCALLSCTFLFVMAFVPGTVTQIHYENRGAPVEVLPIPQPMGIIDLNHADRYELCELPGVGETIADNIITTREEKGFFAYPEDLLNVKGIGPAKLEGFRHYLDFSIAEDSEENEVGG